MYEQQIGVTQRHDTYSHVALSRCQAFGMRVHVNVSVNVNVQEQYWVNVACRQLLAHTNGNWLLAQHQPCTQQRGQRAFTY